MASMRQSPAAMNCSMFAASACTRAPYGLNDPSKALWPIYLIGTNIGCAMVHLVLKSGLCGSQ